MGLPVAVGILCAAPKGPPRISVRRWSLAMAVNRRLVKKANHGKRPCSPKRQKRRRIKTRR